MSENGVQRRLAAILAADVVGYSKLVGDDEVGALRAVKRLRAEIIEPKVAEHQGRLFKTMGDGFLVEFQSAVNAVLCAANIQRMIAQSRLGNSDEPSILMRIGVNVGDVVVEGKDMFGDGVNVAARLEALAEPGGVCISGNVAEQVAKKVPFHFEDLGERSLKNISTPVRAHRLLLSDQPNIAPPSGQDRPSVAVLPFVNMSGDPEQEYFADGLSEDIITALSRATRIAVIARTSTFAYKGKTVDIKRIAQELNVSFILEGSVRRAGDRIRVTAQLIDGSTGAHLWAEKYDGTLDDIFEIQDKITHSVAASTQTSIFSSIRYTPRALELIRSPAHRLAYESMPYLYQMTKEGQTRAAALSEQALSIDPDCALAHRTRANAYLLQLFLGGLPHTRENAEKGVILAREALRRAPEDEYAHWVMALALAESGQYEEAVRELDIGIAINPNASMLLGDKGDYLILMGQAEEGAKLCELALRLNPRDPIRYWWENSIATAHFLQGRAELALEGARRATLSKPDHIRSMIIWAAAAGELGRTDAAHEAIGRCLALFPDINLANVVPHYHLAFWRPDDSRRLIESLRKAGLPE